MKRSVLTLALVASVLFVASCGSPTRGGAVASNTNSPGVPASGGTGASDADTPGVPASGGTVASNSDTPIVRASGLVQKCLGITWGAPKIIKPGTSEYCNQLPGADLYNQAGKLFQSGDHAGAAKLATQAAEAGNTLAQLRLALMYDQGDGVPQSATAAMPWYQRAAAVGGRNRKCSWA